MIDTELLKEKVLDLAMRGKLIYQSQEEYKFLERPQATTKEYSEMLSLIPNTWEIRYLNNISTSISITKKIKVKDIQSSGKYPVITQSANLVDGYYNNIEGLINVKNSIVIFGDHTLNVKYVDFDFLPGADGIKLLLSNEDISDRFFYYLISWASSKINRRGYARHFSLLKSYPLPIPSFSDQTVIEEFLDKAFKIIDHLADQQDKFINYQKLVQDKVLELAMQGKLVPQLPEEGTAASLLEEVAAERQRLIDEKKIKKTKPLPEISEEEIPYEIPESWEWVRLGSIGVVTSGGTPNTSVEDYWKDAHIPWITPAAMSDNNKMYFDELSNMRYINELGYQNSSAKLIKKKSIIYSSRAPIGYINIVPFDYTTNQGCKSLSTFQQVNVEYVYYSIMSRKEEIIRSGSGSTFKEISGTKFSNITIPLPPVKEQERIVNKLDEIDQALFSEH